MDKQKTIQNLKYFFIIGYTLILAAFGYVIFYASQGEGVNLLVLMPAVTFFIVLRICKAIMLMLQNQQDTIAPTTEEQ